MCLQYTTNKKTNTATKHGGKPWGGGGQKDVKQTTTINGKETYYEQQKKHGGKTTKETKNTSQQSGLNQRNHHLKLRQKVIVLAKLKLKHTQQNIGNSLETAGNHPGN